MAEYYFGNHDAAVYHSNYFIPEVIKTYDFSNLFWIKMLFRSRTACGGAAVGSRATEMGKVCP